MRDERAKPGSAFFIGHTLACVNKVCVGDARTASSLPYTLLSARTHHFTPMGLLN